MEASKGSVGMEWEIDALKREPVAIELLALLGTEPTERFDRLIEELNYEQKENYHTN